MEGGIIYGGDFLSEILILHVDSAGEDLYKKLVEVIKESGHNIQKVSFCYGQNKIRNGEYPAVRATVTKMLGHSNPPPTYRTATWWNLPDRF